MKRFIEKVFRFTVFGVILFLLQHFFIMAISNGKCLDRQIESKISKLKIEENRPNIIIAGDSRGERQLIPSVIDSITGCNVINIAVSAGDIVSTVSAIKEHYIMNAEILFLISASSSQINDGILNVGSMSPNCFRDLSVREKFYLYALNIQSGGNMYKEVAINTLFHYFIKENIASYYDDRIIQESGFLGVNGGINYLDDKEISRYLSSHPWYKELSNDGAKWRIFQKSVVELNAISTKGCVILQPPVCPYFKEITKNSVIEKAEIQYSQKIKEITDECDNISLYDFYLYDVDELDDEMYYDYQHLNVDGAYVYSVVVANKINQDFNWNVYRKL